ncbi:4-hydroxy-tetrahydrodipicolinate synthase [Longimicrobium sp.]|uniref:4-hydroxy-tetrahydrodipicolinate synthase n=1 Tax=Longimicrobium sp. TaxID=2029185 RepID=UPI002E32CA6C|nr:4-hydroxy-tetrahydrodipicolinate synthase [Longimicrobium sp.]HEX6037358.1 4-hydroxy-tetrahydrodipicolinate synthase [Longimicrobium sp.]
MPATHDGRTLFTGSGVALVTPFAADGGLNETVLRELVRFHLREGTDALVVNGSTGEASTMSPDEQRRAVEVVAEEARSGERRIPVIAGCGGSDTAAVAKLASAARAAGADALLVAPPPYNKPPQRGIIAHFQKVMDAGDLPTIVYNVPGRTACNILPETVEQMADDERVAGVKEASGDISQVAELARRVGDRVAIYSGNDDQVVPLMALGGQGVISVLANVAPAQTARMAHAFLEGAVKEACALQLRLLPLVSALFREANPIPVKAGVAMLGFDVGEPRLPLVPVSDAVRAELEGALRDLGLRGS